MVYSKTSGAFRLVAALVLLAQPACSSSAPAEQATGEVEWAVPAGWIMETPSQQMRRGQYRLPRAEGDPEDAEMVVFHFPGTGGSIQANIDRWIGQFSRPDGSPVGELAQVRTEDVGGIPVTILEVRGTYNAGRGPRMAPGTPKPDYRLLGAIVDTVKGPWFFKLTGPQKTVAKWEKSFEEFTESLTVH